MSETTLVIIPGGCLQNTKISLKCKAPDEKIEYTFSLSNQLASNEQIVSVQAQPPYGSGLTVDNYTYNVNIFSCRISGGKMLFDEPIRFVISTQKNTIYSFVCVLPIRQQGTLIENCCGMNGVLDSATPMGTLAVGTTTTLEPGSKATVENIGTDSAAVLNFGIPKGPTGDNGKDGTRIEDILITPAGFNFKTSDGKSLEVVPNGIYIQEDIVTVPETVGELPDDLILNGNIYTAPNTYLNGTKQLPDGLSLNSNIVMTDGSVFFPKTINNNGVLCAA